MNNLNKEFSLLEWIFYFVDLAKKYSKALLLCLSLGIVSAIILTLLSKPVYYKSILMTSSVASSERLEAVLLEVLDALEEKNYPIISQALSLSADEAKSVKKIKIVVSPRDIAGMISKDKASVFRELTTEVIISATDSIVAQKTTAGVLSYLNNNPYINQDLLDKRKIWVTRMTDLQKEYEYISELKNKVQNKKINAKSDEVLTLSQVVVDINIKVSEVQDQLDMIKSAVVPIKETVITKKTFKKTLITNLGLGIGLFMAIAFVFIFLKELISLYNAR